MPNWCDNELWMHGSKEDLEKIKAQVTNKEGEFDFGLIVPTPDHPDYNNEPLPAEDMFKSKYNWYNWNVNNWGTKWNASDSVVGEVEEPLEGETNYRLQTWFSTAWAPSTPVTQALSEQYPNVFFEHKFIEEGGFFCGVIEFQNGEETHDSWEDEPSHESMERLGRECICENTDEEYWYPDCSSVETNSIVELAKAMPDNISIINVG